jgi:hypothetical protein
MSDLQISLIILGILIILLVLGFNYLQDRRIRQRMQSHLPQGDRDPLLGDKEATDSLTRREPGLSATEPEHTLHAHHDASSSFNTDEPDESIEIVIELVLPQAVFGAQIMQAIPSGLMAGRKPVRVFWQDEAGRLLSRPNPTDNYERLQFAVLLANRSGPLTDIEWSKIWNRIQSIADALEGHLEGPEQADVLLRANELDALCAKLDSQVALTLMLASNQKIEDVLSGAQSMGFVYQAGVLNWVGDDGLPCFTVSRTNGEPFDDGVVTVDRLSMLLDVPRSPPNLRSFGRMLDVGLELAHRFGADLVDDQDHPVVSGADVPIDSHLQGLYAQLESVGLTAGGARARRVFA